MMAESYAGVRAQNSIVKLLQQGATRAGAWLEGGEVRASQADRQPLGCRCSQASALPGTRHQAASAGQRRRGLTCRACR